jgi:uncharacterized protein (DUF2062 family)
MPALEKHTSMKRWLRRITPTRDALEKRVFLRPFAAVLLDGRCWTFHRNNVIRAFALGLFIAFIPPTPLLPLHMVVCTILGVLLRLNLPVLFGTVFVSNPLTWLPQVFGSIWVGAKLMGMDIVPLFHQMRHQNIRADLHQLWPPLLLGAFVLGLVAALSGYVLAQCLWRMRVVHHMRRRRARPRSQPLSRVRPERRPRDSGPGQAGPPDAHRG